MQRAIEDIRMGKMVILVDDEDRENEGDLVMAAELATPDAINFMAVHGRGLICLSLTETRCEQLNLPLMVSDNSSGFGTAFTVSIEAATGVTTGISAADRARTIRVAVAPNAKPSDLSRPGHVFPLRARRGGVLVRTGQTEGSVDLARLAGLHPAGVICEIMNVDGTMARRPELESFATDHDLAIVSVADLIRYRLLKESLVHVVAETEADVDGIGRFKVITYRTEVDELEHLAFVKGMPSPDMPVLGRVQQENVLGDVFSCGASDSRARLHEALQQIETEGCGVLVYLQKPAPRLENEVRTLAGQAPKRPAIERGAIGLPKDLREYGIGAQILLSCGVRKLRLISNSPGRIKGIQGYGLTVVERIALGGTKNETE
ncbi:MAG: 3,4-dihydroxy-2-butanone-4-phosphate synthase [Myxococcota bacterium]|nr:3,4-dihydroxy-2-butanone-4-phosphate synthase [Myxococcota bacterium]